MGEYRPAALDRTFAALGDPTRRAILARLRRGPHSVGELADPFDLSLNAVSKHIQVLERAGLVHREVDGRVHWCSLEADALRSAGDWIREYRDFWAQGGDPGDGPSRVDPETRHRAAKHRPPPRPTRRGRRRRKQ